MPPINCNYRIGWKEIDCATLKCSNILHVSLWMNLMNNSSDELHFNCLFSLVIACSSCPVVTAKSWKNFKYYVHATLTESASRKMNYALFHALVCAFLASFLTCKKLFSFYGSKVKYSINLIRSLKRWVMPKEKRSRIIKSIETLQKKVAASATEKTLSQQNWQITSRQVGTQEGIW